MTARIPPCRRKEFMCRAGSPGSAGCAEIVPMLQFRCFRYVHTANGFMEQARQPVIGATRTMVSSSHLRSVAKWRSRRSGDLTATVPFVVTRFDGTRTYRARIRIGLNASTALRNR